jgi:hypothetical protein
MPRVTPRDGRKRRLPKTKEEWCSFTGVAKGIRIREDHEGRSHYPGPTRLGMGKGLHPKTERRIRRDIERRKQTHARCPVCGRRLLVGWRPDDGELNPVIPRHKRKK